MKFPNLQSLVPQGEHFDESAIVNEGGYLSINHLNAVEKELSTAGEKITAFDTLNKTLSDQNTVLQNAQTASAATLSDNATKIATLEAEVAELKKAPSGPGSSVITGKDENTDPAPVASWMDDNNPANQFFDQRVRVKLNGYPITFKKDSVMRPAEKIFSTTK